MDFYYFVGICWSIFIYVSVFGDEMNRIGICLGGNVSSRSFLLDQPFYIYVHVEYYDNYEVALKLILNSFIDAEWEEV